MSETACLLTAGWDINQRKSSTRACNMWPDLRKLTTLRKFRKSRYYLPAWSATFTLYRRASGFSIAHTVPKLCASKCEHSKTAMWQKMQFLLAGGVLPMITVNYIRAWGLYDLHKISCTLTMGTDSANMISVYAHRTFLRIIHMKTSEKNVSVSVGNSATAWESLVEGLRWQQVAC